MDEARRPVLVVDDDFDVRDALADVLAELGIPAAFAADGEAALEWLRTHPAPSVILLDWMMPRCDGAAFRAAQLRDPTLAGIPVVLLTADVRFGEKTSAIGAATYLRKPVDLERLSQVLGAYYPARS